MLKRIVVLFTLAALSGCDDETDRLQAENALQRQYVSTLTSENAALLETQTK